MKPFKRLIVLCILVVFLFSCSDEYDIEEQLVLEQEFILSATGEEGADDVDDEKDKKS